MWVILKKILGELAVAMCVSAILATGSFVCLAGYNAISDPLVKSSEEIAALRGKSLPQASTKSVVKHDEPALEPNVEEQYIPEQNVEENLDNEPDLELANAEINVEEATIEQSDDVTTSSKFGIRELPVMNGVKTERIGTYSMCYIPSYECTEETLAEWWAEVKDKGYNWNEIRYTDKDGTESTGVYGNHGFIEKNVIFNEEGFDNKYSTKYVVNENGSLIKVEYEEPNETENIPSTPAISVEDTPIITPITTTNNTENTEQTNVPSTSIANTNNFNLYDNPEQQQTDAPYVLNTNTKKFHYPSCSDVKRIKPENYFESYQSRDEIINSEYEPCKHCNP